MRVLVACEFSGVVRRAFRALGHEAWSCDLLPAEDGSEFHLQGDCLSVLGDSWDLLIAHPPCTRLSNSGVLRLYREGKKINGIDPLKWAEMEAGANFFAALWNSDIARICVENPIMHGHAKQVIKSVSKIPLSKPQRIQPFEFGHPESKATLLWTRGLPRLKHTCILALPECGHWENQTPSGQNKLGPSPERAANRARTYSGIARAMAEQWSI